MIKNWFKFLNEEALLNTKMKIIMGFAQDTKIARTRLTTSLLMNNNRTILGALTFLFIKADMPRCSPMLVHK